MTEANHFHRKTLTRGPPSIERDPLVLLENVGPAPLGSLSPVGWKQTQLDFRALSLSLYALFANNHCLPVKIWYFSPPPPTSPTVPPPRPLPERLEGGWAEATTGLQVFPVPLRFLLWGVVGGGEEQRTPPVPLSETGVSSLGVRSAQQRSLHFLRSSLTTSILSYPFISLSPGSAFQDCTLSLLHRAVAPPPELIPSSLGRELYLFGLESRRSAAGTRRCGFLSISLLEFFWVASEILLYWGVEESKELTWTFPRITHVWINWRSSRLSSLEGSRFLLP